MSETPNQGQGSSGAWPPAEGSQPDPNAWSTPSANPAPEQGSAADSWGQQPTWSASADQPAADAAADTSAASSADSWGSSAGAADWGSAAGSSSNDQSAASQSWGQQPSAAQPPQSAGSASTQDAWGQQVPADPNAWGQSQPSAADPNAWGQQQPAADPNAWGQSQPSAADPNAWGQQPGSAPSASQPSAADPYGYQPQVGQGVDPGTYAQQPPQNPQGYGTPVGGYGQQPGYDQGQQQGQWNQPQDPGQNWQVQPTGAAPYGGPGGFPGGGVADDPTKPSMYQPNQPPPTPGAQPASPSDEKTWATLTHVGMILFGFVGPLIVWLVFKDRSRWIALHAKESLNFGILASIVYIVSAFLMTFIIGFITYPAMGIVALIFGILGAMAANRGEYKPYPFNVRMIK